MFVLAIHFETAEVAHFSEDVAVAATRRKMKRVHAVDIRYRQVGARLDQCAKRVKVPCFARGTHRRLSTVVAGIDISVRGEEQTYYFRICRCGVRG